MWRACSDNAIISFAWNAILLHHFYVRRHGAIFFLNFYPTKSPSNIYFTNEIHRLLFSGQNDYAKIFYGQNFQIADMLWYSIWSCTYYEEFLIV